MPDAWLSEPISELCLEPQTTGPGIPASAKSRPMAGQLGRVALALSNPRSITATTGAIASARSYANFRFLPGGRIRPAPQRAPRHLVSTASSWGRCTISRGIFSSLANQWSRCRPAAASASILHLEPFGHAGRARGNTAPARSRSLQVWEAAGAALLSPACGAAR